MSVPTAVSQHLLNDSSYLIFVCINTFLFRQKRDSSVVHGPAREKNRPCGSSHDGFHAHLRHVNGTVPSVEKEKWGFLFVFLTLGFLILASAYRPWPGGRQAEDRSRMA